MHHVFWIAPLLCLYSREAGFTIIACNESSPTWQVAILFANGRPLFKIVA